MFAREEMPAKAERLWRGERYAHERIRLAYVSGDFLNHATAVLMAELFELHDRARFEVIAISYGPDDRSELRGRLVKAFDQFHDVGAKSGLEIARQIRALEADIAIDLKGYTTDYRGQIFVHRPAPVQANYLGFPGTLGTKDFDYIIADPIVLPPEHEPYYAEQVARLPGCYQVNDRKRAIAAATPSRAEAGLPPDGFVFCCFNNNWKILPTMFDVWMRLLKKAEGGVLWLLRDNDSVEVNLRREAAVRGVDPARLVFAGRASHAKHLARHRLADLFLDTLPYNAHTTASDALWAGLPVLTCRGETFAGRVAASVLQAADLPELVTANLADYETLALRLAQERDLLSDIKAKLARNRDTCRLFDTTTFARHIEAAYTTMWEISQRGEKPRSFDVQP
jgi:predicted O-linked N-acetylglucosamine transferase (SPINDLY family)